MKFSVGDKVLILADHPPNMKGTIIVPGTAGIITSCCYNQRLGYYYHVSFNDGHYDFYEKELEFASEKYALPTPEFDLEDIELAEIIMKGTNQ